MKMAVSGKSILFSGALLLSAFQGSAQTVVRDTSGTRPMNGHLTKKIYQVDNTILASFGYEGYDGLVNEVDEPSDIMPDSTTHSVQKTDKMIVDGHGEVRRFNTRMISSQDNHLAAGEVKSEELLYKSKKGDLILAIEMPVSSGGRNGNFYISGFNAKNSVDFVRVKVQPPFRLGGDEGEMFNDYDGVIYHIDNAIEAEGVDALRGLVTGFGQVAKEALAAEQWQRTVKRLTDPQP